MNHRTNHLHTQSQEKINKFDKIAIRKIRGNDYFPKRWIRTFSVWNKYLIKEENFFYFKKFLNFVKYFLKFQMKRCNEETIGFFFKWFKCKSTLYEMINGVQRIWDRRIRTDFLQISAHSLSLFPAKIQILFVLFAFTFEYLNKKRNSNK